MSKHESPARAPDKTILIADDDALLAQAIAVALDLEGLRTVIAHDGKEALALTRALQPDLILLDVVLPKGSGIEVCANLKTDPATATIPIILITAKTDPRHREAGSAAGADAYLTKPFSPTRLITLVNGVLAGQAIEPQLLEPDVITPRADQLDQLMVFDRELRMLLERAQSQRQALEEKHRRLGELEQLKAAFVSAVTHKLLTPFATIGVPLQSLQRHSEDMTVAQQRDLDDLATAIAGLHQVVNGVVKFAELVTKRREPQPGYYSLAQVIPAAVQTLASLARAREVDFQVSLSSDLPQVYIDPVMVSEAVFQMAHNAVKLNRPGGRARVRVYQSLKSVVIEVWDSGPGLTTEQISMLGQPFQQSDDGPRQGLEELEIGWAFVTYVAMLHDGWTHVESPGPGLGSIFFLAVPMAGTEWTPACAAEPGTS